jgi:uncharacterized protein (DUF433 family)
MKIVEILKYIVLDQKVRVGKPIIKGTNIAVGDILKWMSQGKRVSDIVAEHPELTEKQVYAALAFTARRNFLIGELDIQK